MEPVEEGQLTPEAAGPQDLSPEETLGLLGFCLLVGLAFAAGIKQYFD